MDIEGKDVTEGRCIADLKELREVNAVCQTLIDTIPFGMDIVDEEGNIIFLSKKLEIMAGRDAIGKKCWKMYRDDKTQCSACPLKKGIKVGETKTIEADKAFGGRIFSISHTGMMYKGKKAMLEIFQDITELRKMEVELREALEVKSNFTSMVSHELRTPLTAIKEGINIVFDGMSGEINSKQKEFLGIASRNVDRLVRLINDILEFQRLGFGKKQFVMQENDINEVIKEAEKSMKPQAMAKGLNLTVKVANDLPRINFDRDKIIKVLTNLVSNAIKFTEKGRIVISAAKGDNVIEVLVEDTGRGISEEEMPELFRSFHQLESGKKFAIGRTGLGLAICKEIIKGHNGKIWADSDYGKGTTLHFALPIEERRQQL